MERSSEYGIRCICGQLFEPLTAGTATCRCGEVIPYRVEVRSFYVWGTPGSNRCDCPTCSPPGLDRLDEQGER